MSTPTPYTPPSAPLGDKPVPPEWLTRAEKVLLALLVLNALAGVVFILTAFAGSGSASPVLIAAALLLPCLGFVAAGVMLRRPLLGLALGAAFYLLQSVSYFGPYGAWGVRSGFHASFPVRLGDGAIVVNVLAIAFCLAHVFCLSSRRARSSSSVSRSGV